MRKIFIYLAPLTELGYYLVFFSREWSLKELLCFDSLPLYMPNLAYANDCTLWLALPAECGRQLIKTQGTYASLSYPQPVNRLMFELSLCSLSFLPEACCWKHIYEIFNEYVLWNASGRKFSHACLANNYLPFLQPFSALSNFLPLASYIKCYR